MKCLFCGDLATRVLDSRPVQDSSAVRRRRKCLACKKRFTTIEKPEELPAVVLKRDGRREPFDRTKILKGLILAGQKREISLKTWEELALKIEKQLRHQYQNEIPAAAIGDMVLQNLREIDEVAYLRFASVFRQYSDLEAFKSELAEIAKEAEE